MGEKQKKSNKKNQEKSEELEKQNEELKDMLLRTKAEFDNFQKRTQKEKEELKKTASEKIIKKIIPVLDNLELALQSHKKQDDFSKGIEMIYANILQLLEEEGLQKINIEKFDANLHEVIMVEQGEKEQIIELQKGYKIGDKILRNTKIKLIKGDEK
ncbi:MAG: nucleotide exchange factor GrpE [Candidatus Woesearchaeota archaeon]